MYKFVIYSRKGKTTVYEVECEKILPMEDPSIMWAPQGEYRARIFRPETLFEPDLVDGTKMVPPVWCDHAFYETSAAALAVARKWVRHELVDYQIQKKREPKSEDEVRLAEDAISIVILNPSVLPSSTP